MRRVNFHWADLASKGVINEFKWNKLFVCAAGITPSGTIHIGNFREIITVDLVSKALNYAGKRSKFIYSWDDYDRLRKIPKNLPKQGMLKRYLGKPIIDTPDPFDCHKSYAEHFEKELEKELPKVGVKPEFLYQSKKYRKCEYANEIKYILNKKDELKKILNKYRKEPLPEDWIPLGVYCEKCETDHTKVTDYDGNYKITYECECGFKKIIDFRKKGIVKLPWRLDWPMRWHYENVSFEPGGKEHSTPGGSRDTAKLIFETLYSKKAPLYLMYDYIILKGIGGKMSSSLGNVITLKDCLEIYEPEVIRYFFAGTRPNTEFSISFDLDVLKIYEDYDKCERIYYGKEKVENKKAEIKQKRIYELSQVEGISKKIPQQVPFRHLTALVQIYEGDVEKAVRGYKGKNIKVRAKCAWNWLQKYAPENMKFKINKTVPKSKLNKKQKDSLRLLLKSLEKKSYNEKTLFKEFYNICIKVGIKNTEFFKGAYLALIGKEQGPKLANFILTLGKKRIIDLLKSI